MGWRRTASLAERNKCVNCVNNKTKETETEIKGYFLRLRQIRKWNCYRTTEIVLQHSIACSLNSMCCAVPCRVVRQARPPKPRNCVECAWSWAGDGSQETRQTDPARNWQGSPAASVATWAGFTIYFAQRHLQLANIFMSKRNKEFFHGSNKTGSFGNIL